MRRRHDADDPEMIGRRTGTDDLPLFSAPVPYQRESATSREAAEALLTEASRLRRITLGAFRAAGPAGLTADQAAEVVGETVLAIRPRVTELRQNGMLEPTGERRENASGMSAAVLRAAESTLPHKGPNCGTSTAP